MKFKCNLCGSSKKPRVLRTIDTPDRFEYESRKKDYEYKRHWVQCSECGAGVHMMDDKTTRLVSEIGEKYYDLDLGGLCELEKKYNKVMAMPESDSDNAGRSRRVAGYVSESFSDVGKKAVSVCDIGSGLGLFPSKLIDVSVEYSITVDRCVAVETDPLACEFLSRLPSFEVRNGIFPDVVIGESFSVISLNKVLEHVKDPRKLLRSCLWHLEENGFLYIEVPCLSNAWIKPKDDAALQIIHHNLYEVSSISRALSEEGFYVCHAERIIEPSGKITTFVFARRLVDLV